MSRKKPTLVLVTPRIVSLLTQEINKKKIESHFLLRFQIILLSNEGKTNPQIADQLSVTLPTVRLWRLRWHENSTFLLALEKAESIGKNSATKIVREIKLVLSDAHRSGSSCRISMKDKLRLQALACQSPADYDLPISSWTHIELSKQAGKLGINISSSYYGKVLKKRITSA